MTELIEISNTLPESPDTNEVPSQVQKPSEQSLSTPPPTTKNDLMKDPAFLTSPVYPQLISRNDSISTQRNDYLLPILSNNNFSFKSQLTSMYMHPTDYKFKLYDKN